MPNAIRWCGWDDMDRSNSPVPLKSGIPTVYGYKTIDDYID